MRDRPPLTANLTRLMKTVVAGMNSQVTQIATARVPELRIVERGKPRRVKPLGAESQSLGRSSQCDIILQSSLVGREHARLRRHPRHRRQFFLQDLHSSNGTFCHGRPLGQQEILLKSGDRFTLAAPDYADAVRLQLWAPPPLGLRILRWAVTGTSVLGVGVVGLLAATWLQFPNRLPSRGPSGGPIIVRSRDGQPLRPIQSQPYRALPLQEFSPYLPAAVIASEDSNFYWHFGFDPKGILRAVFINLQRGGPSQGASTLTQQLARSVYPDYVGRENSLERKLKELAVALKIETLNSKDRILEEYLNRVYLGGSNAGFEAAAQFYFEKSAADLNLGEAATLAAVLPAPNAFNPVQDYETAIGLRNRVLERMEKLGSISATDANQARRAPIVVSDRARANFSQTRAPYFYDRVLTELRTLLTADVAAEGNFIIDTGLDLTLQAKAEAVLSQAIATQGPRYGFSQGAIVTLDANSGEILALVGGADYKVSQYNRATSAQRQPGSTFKVFAYAAALDAGISPQQTHSCAPLSWQGQQFRGCERSAGQAATDMYGAMAQSENAVALRVAQAVGLPAVVRTARDLGVRSPLQAVPGLVLGQSEVTLLEMTGAYAPFASQGQWQPPHTIRQIFDGNTCDLQAIANCTPSHRAAQRRQAIDPAIADRMHALLQGVVRAGTGRSAYLGRGEAGKTGTTNRAVDLWFVGYVTDDSGRTLVTGVWLGNDDNRPTQGSSSQAAALWRDYMGRAMN